jgi:hypothetical protein
MIIKDIANTIRFVRELGADDIRGYALSYADDVLGRYGYVRKPSMLATLLPVLGAFGAGLALGTGVGLLIAPTSGAETRRTVVTRVNGVVDRIKQATARKNGTSTIVTSEKDINPSHV